MSDDTDHEWAEEQLRDEIARLRAENERLRGALTGLCQRLDKLWYESDPDAGEPDGVKKGEPHPWTKEARAALEEKP